MTDRIRRLRQRHDTTNPLLGLHPSPELWGARDPTDLRPKISLCVDEGWFEAHWYGDRPEPSPGLLRQAFHALWSGTEALRRAIGRLPLRVRTRHGPRNWPARPAV
jgi:hypothetical protein